MSRSGAHSVVKWGDSGHAPSGSFGLSNIQRPESNAKASTQSFNTIQEREDAKVAMKKDFNTEGKERAKERTQRILKPEKKIFSVTFVSSVISVLKKKALRPLPLCNSAFIQVLVPQIKNPRQFAGGQANGTLEGGQAAARASYFSTSRRYFSSRPGVRAAASW